GCEDVAVDVVERDRMAGNLYSNDLAFGQIATGGGTHPARIVPTHRFVSWRRQSPFRGGRRSATGGRGMPADHRQNQPPSSPPAGAPAALSCAPRQRAERALRLTRFRLATARAAWPGGEPGG